MKILIVDDSKSIHSYLRETLLPYRPELEFAFDGAQAVAAVKGGKFDLVLMDWEMPVMTGPEAVEQMRLTSPHLPIIIMTTRNAQKDLVHALTLGASEYMMKPFTHDILIAKIEQILAVRMTHAA